MNETNIQNRKITIRGLILIKDGKRYKYETELYKKLKEIRGNNKNTNQVYLELYQKEQLSEYLQYVSPYSQLIINRISISIKTISREILNLYHATRNKQNTELYNKLPELYKKILYKIHGIFIESKKRNNK